MEKNNEGRRINGAKYLLRRRLSATSGSKLGSDFDRGAGADFAHKEKKLKKWQEEGNEELLVVEQRNECDGRRTGGSSTKDENDAVEKSGRGEMGGGAEGEEAVDQLKRVSKTHNDGKVLDDCTPVHPATVPRKLRSAMNKRNCESISPPLPELKKHNASNRSKMTTMAHANGIKISKQGKKQSNAVSKSTRKETSMAVTKAEEEVAEALYVLSRISPTSSVRSRTGTEIEEAKTSTSPEDKASKLPSDFPTEASSKKQSENAEAVKADMSRSSVEVHTSAAANGTPFFEKLELESDAQIDIQNNSQFNKQSSASPLTDVQNNLVLPCGQPNSENGIAEPFILNLLPSHEAEQEPLQPAIIVPQREEPSDRSSCLGSAGIDPVPRHIITNCYSPLDLGGPAANKAAACQDSTVRGTKSLLHLDLSGPPSIQVAAPQDSAVHGTVSALAEKPLAQGKKSWKRCATHVHLCHFIHVRTSVEKVPRWARHCNQPSEWNEGAKAVSDCSNYKDNRSCSLTTASERNPQVACLQLLSEKMPVSSPSYSRKPQSIDFFSLSSGGGDQANVGKPSNSVESSVLVNSSFIQSLQHQSVLPFSVRTARLPTSYADQQPAATQQVQLPQYLANPFLNPHFAAAAVLTATTPAGKQQQQLWASDLMQYYQPTQFPKSQNGRNDRVSLLPCSQSGSSPVPLSMAYAHSSQLFPVSSSGNKKPQQKHEEQIFRSDGPSSHMRLLSDNDRR